MSTTQVAAALVIALGADVACRDGHAGHVHRLVVDPESRRVTDLVVEHGLLRHRVVVPVSHIARTEDGVIHLDVERHELPAFPAYVAVDVARPDPAWTARHGADPGDGTARWRNYTPWGVLPSNDDSGVLVRRHLHTGVPEPRIPLGRSTHVASPSGQVGHLAQILLDPETHSIRALVSRAGHIRPEWVHVGADQITGIMDDEIAIDVDL